MRWSLIKYIDARCTLREKKVVYVNYEQIAWQELLIIVPIGTKEMNKKRW